MVHHWILDSYLYVVSCLFFLKMNWTWEIVYESAIRRDGSLYFHKLTAEFLANAKRTLGSYKYANQYENIVIPADLQCFKREWIQYYTQMPKRVNTFMFIDPAISQADTADFTGVVVVHVDYEKRWYVSYARRHKITPTQILDLIFSLNEQFKPTVIGIESVAYQKALFYFLHEEMRRRDVLLPIKDVVPPTTKTKQMRILSLVPRLEFGHMFFNQGLQDLELEMMQFPRGVHDDLIDALASIEYISTAPEREKDELKEVGPQHPDYEKYWISQRIRRNREESAED